MSIEQQLSYQLNDLRPEQGIAAIREHLEFLYAGAEGHAVITWKSGGRWPSKSFELSALERAAHYIASLREDADVWATTCIVGAPMDRRPSSADASAISFVSLDFDCAWGKHENTYLPGSPDDLHRVIDAAGAPPFTRALFSGGGLLAIWALEEPLAFSTAHAREEAEGLMKNFQGRLRDAASTLGWKLDNTADLARLTRLPETLNHKYDPKRVVRAWGEEGPRLTLAGFRELGQPTKKASKRAPSSSAARQETYGAAPRGKPSVDSIRAGCAFIAHAFDNAETLSEPEWKAAIDIVSHCEDGAAHAHAMSSPYPDYDERETQTKIERSVGFGKPRTCAHIRDELKFDGCRRCPFSATCGSPTAIGHKSEVVAEIARDYVYVADRERFLHLPSGQQFTSRAIDTYYAHRFTPEERASQVLTRWPRALKVRSSTYEPMGALKIGDALNLWQHGGVEPKSGPMPHIENLLETILSDPQDRNHLLDLLAFLVQRPGEKINQIAVIRGVPGSGKSTLEHLARGLVGPQNCKVAQGSCLVTRFWADLMNSQVLFIEEASLQERAEVANRMKELITARHMQVEEKNIALFRARTPDLVFAISNEDVPIRVELGDRRAWIPPYGREKQSEEFYSALYRFLDAELPALKGALLSRDIRHFNPAAHAPMTGAKCEVIEFSRPEVEQHLKRAIDDRRHPFDIDLVVPEELITSLQQAGFATINVPRIRKALRTLRAESVGQLPSNCPGAPGRRVWAVRDVERWKTATPAELRDHYSRQSVIVGLASPNGERAA